MEVQDIIYTTDIIITSSGDLKVGLSDKIHISDILESNKGQYYQYPEIGYGAGRLLNAVISLPKIKKEIRNELERDNYRVDDVIIDLDTTGKIDNLEVDAIRLR